MSNSHLSYARIPVADYAPEEEEDWEDYRWCGNIPEPSDFADIRYYADCCLQGHDPKGKWSKEVLSPDLDVLDGVLWQLGQGIPWFTEEQEKQAIDHLPERPVSLPRPIKKGRPVPKNKLAYKEWREKQDRLEELQRYWDQNRSELRERVELGKLIAMRKKAHLVKKNAIARLRKQISEIQKNGNDLPAVQELNWVILPGGESIWPRVSRCVEAIKRRHPTKQVDESRLEKIITLKPDSVYQGKHEFDGYFVFLFRSASRAVLECPWVGNAIYVIDGDWRKLSCLTKSDLLHNHGHEVRRIIHRDETNWFTQLQKSLNNTTHG